MFLLMKYGLKSMAQKNFSIIRDTLRDMSEKRLFAYAELMREFIGFSSHSISSFANENVKRSTGMPPYVQRVILNARNIFHEAQAHSKQTEILKRIDSLKMQGDDTIMHHGTEVLVFELLDLLPRKIECLESKEALLPRIDFFDDGGETRQFLDFAGRNLTVEYFSSDEDMRESGKVRKRREVHFCLD